MRRCAIWPRRMTRSSSRAWWRAWCDLLGSAPRWPGAWRRLQRRRAPSIARLEERVAKAPVKMMMPTGALILPAMLLLVLGPVLLELANGV